MSELKDILNDVTFEDYFLWILNIYICCTRIGIIDEIIIIIIIQYLYSALYNNYSKCFTL